MSLEILVSNRQNTTRVAKKKIIYWAKKILKALCWKNAVLSIEVMDNTQIRRLHKKFMNEDSATDVLAFEGTRPSMGDIAVSVEMAKRQAPLYGNRWDEELLLYICHGTLHLMGFKDQAARDRKQMRAKEKQILRKVLGASWPSKKPKPLF